MSYLFRHLSQHVSKFVCVPPLLSRNNQAILFDGSAVSLPLLFGFVHFAVLSLQVETQDHGQGGHGKHGRCAGPHAAGVVRRFAVGIETRADKGPALADELHEGEATALTALVGLVVDVPGDDEGDDVEEADGGGVDCEVADERGDVKSVGEGKDGVAQGRGEGVEDDGGSSGGESIGHVSGKEDDEEGEEVRRRAEGLGGKPVVAHLGEDFGEEDGEGGVGHVCEEEHGGGDPCNGVAENGEDLTGFETG